VTSPSPPRANGETIGGMRSLALVLPLFAALVACGDPPPPPKAPPVSHGTSHHRPAVPPPVLAPTSYSHEGPSYDEALAIPEDLGETKGSRELTDSELKGPVASGQALADCNTPDDMKVVVKVAVKDGHAMGVTVSTDPQNAEIAGCIDKAVRAMTWPSSAKRFSFVTSF
jgi:hypothetical protein